MSPQTRKRARSLLALFLALYAAFTLLPGGVYALYLSLIHISEPTRQRRIEYED